MTAIERGMAEAFAVDERYETMDGSVRHLIRIEFPNVLDFRSLPEWRQRVMRASRKAGVPFSDLWRACEAWCSMHGAPEPENYGPYQDWDGNWKGGL